MTIKRKETTKEKIQSIIIAAAMLAAGLTFNSCGSGIGQSRNKNEGGHLSGRLSLSGAFALYPLTVKWATDFQALHPDVKIEIDGGGAGKGMTDVLANQVEFGMLSREVKPEEASRGAMAFPVAKDAVVPTINEKNPYYSTLVKKGITASQAHDIWITGKIKTWGDLLGDSQPEKIAVFTRSDACGAAETFAAWFGDHQENLLGEGVNGDPSAVTAVMRNALSIGFNNLAYVYDSKTKKPLDGIRVLPIDADGNGQIDAEEQFYDTRDQLAEAISKGLYPTPPARNLYLVTNGHPTDPVVIAFLQYILTKGQESIKEIGYVELPEEERSKILKKLK